MVFEPSVDGLYISEDALPVGFTHRDHVVHIQQWVDARLLICNFESERKVVAACFLAQLRVVEGVWQEVMYKRTKCQPVRPAR